MPHLHHKNDKHKPRNGSSGQKEAPRVIRIPFRRFCHVPLMLLLMHHMLQQCVHCQVPSNHFFPFARWQRLQKELVRIKKKCFEGNPHRVVQTEKMNLSSRRETKTDLACGCQFEAGTEQKPNLINALKVV